MSVYTLLLLAVSVLSSTVRAVFSKKLGISVNGKCEFYKTQAYLFFFAAAGIFIFNFKEMNLPSRETFVFGAVYGVFTVLAQWLYTNALGKISVSICTMVYSFGFIIPTVFGTIVWHESIDAFRIISILLCIFTVILSSLGTDVGRNKSKKGAALSLIFSMIASGMLGIVQKIQQKSAYQSETGSFLLLAFILACLISATASLIKKNDGKTYTNRKNGFYFWVITVGVAMAAANTANTLLAGRLPSAIAFPITNVGVILVSFLVSVMLLKESITRKQIAALCTGTAAVVMFGLT